MYKKSSGNVTFNKFFKVLCAISLVALLVPTAALGAPQQEPGGTEVVAQSPAQEGTEISSSADSVEPSDAEASENLDEAQVSEAPFTEDVSDDAAATDRVDDLAAAGAAVNAQSEDKEVQPQAGADLSQYLSNFSFDLLQYIDAGNTPVITPGSDLTRFEQLGLITEFEVSGVPAGINSGDYFSFKATIPGMSGDSATYTNKPFYVGGVSRGTWSTVYTPATETDPAYITYTITLDDSWHGVSTDLIKAGIKIERFGQNADNENLNAGGHDKDKNVTVGTETSFVNKGYHVPGYNPNVLPITNKKDVKKAADQGNNKIFWMMEYGWANMAKLVESEGAVFANNGADGQVMNPMAQDNILIDTLSYTDTITGKTVKASSVNDIVIGSLFVAPVSASEYTGNENAQIVADKLGDTKGINSWYTRVDGNSGGFATVQDYANSLQARQYGVYTAADGTLSVCVNYGKYGSDDTPTMEWAYGSNWATNLANQAIGQGFVPASDKAALVAMIEKIYGSDNVLGGHIPYIQLNVVAQYPYFDEDGNIIKTALNKVTTSTEEIGQAAKNYSNVFSWGEVKPNQLKVFKYDSTTNAALAGAKIKLQQKQADGSWSDYAPLDGAGGVAGAVLRTTGADGMVVWDNIQVGDYRVVETFSPEGYFATPYDIGAGGVIVGSFSHPSDGLDAPGHTMAVPNAPVIEGELELYKKLDSALSDDNIFYFKVSGPLGYYRIVPVGVAAGSTEGTVVLTSLQPGDYTVTEVKNAIGDALEGDRLTTDKYSFTVSGNNTKATVGNISAPVPAVTITNTKAAYAEVTPAASKKLSGTLPAGFSETFTAAITAKTTGAPMPDTTTATATVNSNAETAFSGFDAITFTAPGTYEYEIAEQIGSTLGMVYDNNVYTMKVVVSDAFGVDVTYSAVAPNTTAANKAQIKNTYVTPTAKVTPQATKTLTGTLPNGFSETFTATIAAADSTLNAPLPATTTATATVTNNTETAFSGFGEISYTTPGTYEYYITETKGATNTIAYDTTVYNMKVVVNNDFTTTVTYSGNNTAADKAQVKNTYTPPAVEVTPQATKTLTGDLPANFSEEFTATIAAKTANAPMPTTTTAKATVTNNTETAFAGFSAITFATPGTYEYNITETAGSKAGITYDANTYVMKVVVDNDMKATVTYSGNNTATDKAQIKNTYIPRIEVTGTKVWNDFSDKFEKRPDTISLTLYANGQAVSPQPTPWITKTVGSDEWTYSYTNLPKSDNNGDIVYTVTEAQVDTYFAPEYRNATGAEVQQGAPDGGSIVNNLNTPSVPRGDDVVSVSGTKFWNDDSDAAGIRPSQLTLTLTDETGAVIPETPVWQKTSNNTWEYLYSDLPQKDSAGNVKVYYVTEEVVPGYFAAEIKPVSPANGNYAYDLTNTIIKPTDKAIVVTATKVWEDNANADKTRPENIKFTLLDANGEAWGGTPEWTKNDDNTWTCMWSSLPAGTYKVDEMTVTGYKDPVYGEVVTDADGNITTTVTNTKDITTPKPSVPATTKAATAKTADSTPVLPWGAVGVVSMLALFVTTRKLHSN